MVPTLLEAVFETAIVVSIEHINMLFGITNTMSQDECSQIACVMSLAWEFRTIFGNCKNQFDVVQSDIVLAGPIVEIVLDGKLFGQIGSLLLDEGLYLSIVSRINGFYTSDSLNLCRT